MLTNLKNKQILGSSGHGKSMVVNTEVQNGYCLTFSYILSGCIKRIKPINQNKYISLPNNKNTSIVIAVFQ